jgi:MFS family permease
VVAKIKKYLSPAMRNILLIGMVSFFIDMSTEMVYPLIPLYLTATLGASPAIVGIIEGIAESAAAFFRVFSGYLGDKYNKKKQLAFGGYSAALFYKAILFFSGSWVGVLIARSVDRVGKGLRTAPRDALVAESGTGKLGTSFGIHKMLDMAGAAMGGLLAFFILRGGFSFKPIFLLSVIPAVLGLICILWVKEKPRKLEQKEKFTLRGVKLDRKLKIYLAIVFIFCLGNSSNAFLLLKAQNAGFSSTEIVLLYLLYNVCASLLAFPCGKLSDKFGRRMMMVPAYLVFGLVYMGFALLHHRFLVIALFALYGIYAAAIAGAERAFLSEAAPAHLKGTLFGLHGMLQGFGLLLASMIAGLLWNFFGANAPFYFGGGLALFAAVATAFVMKQKRGEKTVLAAITSKD